MKRRQGNREGRLYELFRKNPWYRYEWEKKYLNSGNREVEVRNLTRTLKV